MSADRDPQPTPPSLVILVEQCLDRMEAEGPDALERFCAEHPSHAEAIRRRIRSLGAAGLLGGAEPATLPDRLGEFALVRELGRGGMGVVFEAFEPSLDRHVALKVLSAHLTLEPQSVARFQREARLAAGLDHPGIVKVFRVGSEGGHHWFAMELIEGTSLDRVIRALQDGTAPQLRPLAWRVERMVEVAEALVHAHAAGVLHRDVKPANILLRTDGRAVLSDFGLSRVASGSHVTRTGATPGTPQYMSPEQAAGLELDARTDVYSLGVTLFQLLTLKLPHTARSMPELLRRIQHEEVPDPARLNPALPADLVAVTLKALEKDRSRRYQTAAELLADLRAFLEDRPVVARRAGPTERLRRWVRKEPLRAALAAILLLGVPVVTGLLGFLLASRPTLRAGTAKLRWDEVERVLTESHLLVQEGDLDGSERQLAQIVASDPQWSEAQAVRALLARRRAPAPGASPGPGPASHPESRPAPRTPFEWFLQSTLAFDMAERLGDPAAMRRALEMVDRAILMAPAPRPIFLTERAEIAVGLRDLEAMAASADSLLALWPDEPAALFHAGRCRHYGAPDGQRAAAFAAFQRALELRPGWRTARRGLADLLAGEQRNDEALAEYEAVLAQRPDQWDTLCNYARVLVRAGRYSEAIAAVERSLQGRPGSATALAVLGHARAESGDDRGALAEFARALAINPRHHYSLMQTGRVALRLRDFGAAETAFQTLLDQDPRDGEATYNLGLVHAQRGDLDSSVPLFERAVELLPGDAEALTNLGSSLVLLGRVPEAIARYRSALALDPRLLQAHRGLTMALRKAKDGEGLRAEEERWRRMGPADAAASSQPATRPER